MWSVGPEEVRDPTRHNRGEGPGKGTTTEKSIRRRRADSEGFFTEESGGPVPIKGERYMCRRPDVNKVDVELY